MDITCMHKKSTDLALNKMESMTWSDRLPLKGIKLQKAKNKISRIFAALEHHSRIYDVLDWSSHFPTQWFCADRVLTSRLYWYSIQKHLKLACSVRKFVFRHIWLTFSHEVCVKYEISTRIEFFPCLKK